jgi:class 3 adenylate cyclase
MSQRSNQVSNFFLPNSTYEKSDISGFTAWSSVRDPAQVFTLLESVYQAFDKIARKRGVFKVETIGDSYVAVTGLPDPQEDHALIMCRFARDCRAKMNAITQSLDLTLGPDTSDLKMRFGLHSGPVTAGVLRGEKSRFQLFGDTVNTAARMESTGQRDQIQLSATTADLVTKAGKGHWIRAREEKVLAKGKGELQTYWFHPQNSRRSISSTISDDSLTKQSDDIWGNQEDGEADDSQLDIMQQKQKHIRLIDYNVDLLAGLLRQVIAQRRMLNLAKIDATQEPAPVFSREKSNVKVLDEVVEVISLPEFDAAAYKGYVDPETINLGPAVKAQLKRYVAVIAAMYRNNPFHNFEHASHVTMSVNKLLQRIVAPEMKVRRRSLQMGGKELASDLHHYTYGITSDPLTQLAIVFAALIHDCDHWGVSNQQLVQEGVPIAEKYQNKSVAEQNSVDLAWDLLMDEEEYGELLKCMFATQSELDRFRQVVVNVVMATDIFDPELLAMRQARWEKAFTERDDDTPNRKATIVIEHIVQASDVAHSMQHWHVYQKWNRRLFDELYTAYRAGRMAKDPSEFWVDGEVKFFDSYVIPLAKKLKECGVFGVSSEECLNYAMNNRNEWKSKGAQIVAELVLNYKLRDEEEAERLRQEELNKENGKKRRFARRRSLFTSGG